MKTLRIAIPVPVFLCGIADSILQIYSRIRYGRNTRLISLGMGKFALVDADDYPSLGQNTWSIRIAGKNKYAVRHIVKPGNRCESMISMHREIMGSPKDMCVDHINGNGLDNRKSNLRLATHQQNNWNTKKRRGKCSSRFKGVSWYKSRSKWVAKIKCDRKTIHLGYFNDEEDAARAYDAKAGELYGEFANKNFPDT